MTCRRLEDDHLLADLGGTLDAHVEQCEDCRARLCSYQKIAMLLADGATFHRAPTDWGQRTLARVKATQHARRRRVATLSALSAAAMVGIALLCFAWRPGAPDRDEWEKSIAFVRSDARTRDALASAPAPRLAMQVVERGGWRGEAHPGEEVHARAEADGSYVEIRVYRGARSLVVRCPGAGSPVCLDAGRVLVWKVPAVGTYQVVLLVSPRPIAAPRGALEDDVAAATAAGARIVMEALDVR